MGVHSKATMSGGAGCRGPQAGGEGNLGACKYVVCIMYVLECRRQMGSFESKPGLGSLPYLYVCKPGGVGCRGPQAGGEGNPRAKRKSGKGRGAGGPQAGRRRKRIVIFDGGEGIE